MFESEFKLHTCLYKLFMILLKCHILNELNLKLELKWLVVCSVN